MALASCNFTFAPTRGLGPSAAQTINFCRQDNKFLSSICDVAEAVAHWHLGEFEHVLISVDDAISLC